MQTSKLADLDSWAMTLTERLESSHKNTNINIHWDKFLRIHAEDEDEEEESSDIFDGDCELQNCSRRNLGIFVS